MTFSSMYCMYFYLGPSHGCFDAFLVQGHSTMAQHSGSLKRPAPTPGVFSRVTNTDSIPHLHFLHGKWMKIAIIKSSPRSEEPWSEAGQGPLLIVPSSLASSDTEYLKGTGGTALV